MHIIRNNFKLTTAEIIYLMPDHPSILQSFIWQKIDTAPEFPKLKRFLTFWEDNIDGPIHSVRIVGADLVGASIHRGASKEFVLH